MRSTGPIILRNWYAVAVAHQRPPRQAQPSPRSPLILRRPDVVTLASVFLVLQFLIPARLVVGNLGAAGRPSLILALGVAILWVSGFFQHRNLSAASQPVRWIVGVYVLVQVASYLAGIDRGLPGIEARSADRWMIVTFALAGLAVAVADGIGTRDRLDVLLGRLVGLSSIMALVGVIQSVLGLDLTQYIRLPGLQLNSQLIGVGNRGATDLARVAGTANHYIEFGVVLATVLPLALHRALFRPSVEPGFSRWLQVALIAGAIPLSISRSGMVGLFVSFAILSIAWTWKFRLRAALVGLVSLVIFRLVQPGVLGTLRALFVRADDDPSVQNRIADYEYVTALWPERPLLGRGAGTLIPDLYILLDNQYLNTLLSSGLLGLAALLALFGGTYLMARSVRLRGESAEQRHLGQALAAAIACLTVCAATFDSLSFATYNGVLFLLVGVVGALWAIDGGPRSRRALQGERDAMGIVAVPWMAERRGLSGVFQRFPVPERSDGGIG